MKRVAPDLVLSSDRQRSASGDASTGFGAALLVAVATAAVAVLALWPVGAGNDQGLFVHYGRLIRDGATLYRDVWDNKQPGIFAWYAVAGALFGDGWPAARLAYALWLGAGAGVASAICRIVAPRTNAWLLAPVLTVGIALLRTNSERPAQVEALMGLPLSALLLLCLIEPATVAGRRWRWVAAGALTGVVSALKAVLAPVAATIIAAGLIWRLTRGEISVARGVAAIGLSLVGFACVWAPVFGYFQVRGAMPEFLWTMFGYSSQVMQQVEMQKPAMLIGALRWLAVTVGLLLPAVALYAWRTLRRRRAGPDTLLLSACLGWVVVGLAMIVLQRFSWWDTHMDLIAWPIGLLAALGLARPEPAGFARPADRNLSRLVLALAAVALLAHGARFGQRLLRDPDWPKPRIEVEALAIAQRVAQAARTPCGTVYAIGDQAGVERATGLRQAIPTHGLWFGAFLPAQMRRLPAELQAARPDLVYFDGNEHRDFLRRLPAETAVLDAWLARDYERRDSDGFEGQWWQRRVGPDDAATCPAPLPFRIPASAAPA
jgi:hypothetical protein